MTNIKVGQKYLDERGHVREIIQVLGDRVAYVNLTLDEKRQKPVGTCPLNAFDQDTLLEEGVTFTKAEATLLKRLLAGYAVGPAGQSILNKLGSIVVLLIVCYSVGCGQSKPVANKSTWQIGQVCYDSDGWMGSDQLGNQFRITVKYPCGHPEKAECSDNCPTPAPASKKNKAKPTWDMAVAVHSTKDHYGWDTGLAIFPSTAPEKNKFSDFYCHPYAVMTDTADGSVYTCLDGKYVKVKPATMPVPSAGVTDITAGTGITYTATFALSPVAASAHDSINKGVYTFTFTDPNNRWRCQVSSIGRNDGADEASTATIVCSRPIPVTETK